MATLIDGLAAYWKLDEASGTRVDAHRSNDLTPSGAPGNTTGKIGNAVNMVRASSQYLYCADNTDLSTGDIDFTFSCWVKLVSKPANHMMFFSKRASGTNWEYQLIWNYSSDRLEFYIMNNAGTSVGAVGNALGAPALGTWYHVVCWHNAAGNVVGIRINDQYENTAATGTVVPSDSTAQFFIGSSQDGGAAYAVDGVIDEVGFWKRLLTAAEKTSLYNGGAGLQYPFNISLHEALYYAYHMDEASGQRKDAARANHLTAWNAPGVDAGKLGQAVVCDTAKALYCADNADISTGNIPFTISCWVYITTKPAQYMGIIGKYHNGGNPNEFLLYYEYSNDRFLWEPGGYSVFATALGSPTLNTWYHILIWYDPYLKEGGIRVNDQYQNIDTSGVAPPDSADELDIGTFDNRNNANVGFRGRIDEVYFWKRLLAKGEKAVLYNSSNAYGYPWGKTLNRGQVKGVRRGVMRGV